MNEKIQELRQTIALKSTKPGVFFILEQIAEILQDLDARLHKLENIEEVD